MSNPKDSLSKEEALGSEVEINARNKGTCVLSEVDSGSRYRMETGQDLIDIKQSQPQRFPPEAWCLECSWEVANKQGGIYTVLRSKASSSVKEMGDHYLLLGPLKPSYIHEVETLHPDPSSPLGLTLARCREKGWKVLAGRWLVEGNPRAILFDIGSAACSLGGWKQELYNLTHIGIPHADTECNDLVIFGFMMAEFVSVFRWHLEQCQDPVPMVVTHCHEWMAGVALILLRLWKVSVATVFTTHATLLGRHLCAGSVDFYNSLPHFNLDVEAGKRGIYHRYCLERAASHLAHVFTTVSHITAEEADNLIKRRPDLVTPNGLDVKRNHYEFHNRHAQYKEKIQQFVQGHFHGHINFDLDKTLFFFTAGRYEFGNKGGDIFIEALSRLNYYLKSCGSEVTIVAFIIFPAKNLGFNAESLEGQAINKTLQTTISSIQTSIGQKMYEACCRGNLPDTEGCGLLSREDQVKMKRIILASQRRSSWPPITTHTIVDEASDPVMKALKRCNLLNDPADRVKVVFHPDFLNVDNPLLGLRYEEFVQGCHLGCFPSYYEPWGYTPAECTVMGIPSVTTNLSGFGCFIEEHVQDPALYGIYVLDRRFLGVEESVLCLAQNMFEFSQLSRKQRIIMRNRTERLSDLLDWGKLGQCYTHARIKALFSVFQDVELGVGIGVGELGFKIPRPASTFSSGSRREAELNSEYDYETETNSVQELLLQDREESNELAVGESERIPTLEEQFERALVVEE